MCFILRSCGVLAVLLFSEVVSSTFVAFTADITVLYDPSIQGGLKGKMWYQYDGINNYKKLQFDLVPTNGVTSTYTQLYNYTAQTLYLKCPSNCSATMFTSSIESFFSLPSEKNGTSACSSNTRAYSTSENVVNTIGFNKNGTICFAIYGNGRRIEFSNVVQRTTTFDSSVFSIASWGCPARKCSLVMDLILILDVSGSIDDAAWASLQQFSSKLATAFTISPAAVNFGVVAFSDYAVLVLDLSSSASDVQYAISHNIPRLESSTCIGCGIFMAVDSFGRVTSSRTSMKPRNVTIIITDGGNNEAPWSSFKSPSKYLSASLTKLKGSPYNDLSIVVSVATSDYTPTVLAELSTNSSSILGVSGYTSLMTIIDKVISTTCTDFTPTTCSSSCMGFCGCSGECLCPNYCPTGGNACIKSSCSSVSNVLGCWNTSVSCSDGSACTTDTCDISKGCVFTPVNCASSDLCLNPVCSNTTGCYTQPVICSQSSKCSTYSCNSSDGKCHANPVDCDDGNACTTDYCSESSGCMHLTNCSDNNPCKDDICESKACVHTPTHCAAPDLCHNSSCVAGVGCVNTAVTCTSQDSCHTYSCSAGVCAKDALPGNATCLNCAKNPCNSSSAPSCSFYICSEDSSSADGTGRKCTLSYNISNAQHPCNDGNPCTTDSCDSSVCHHTAFDGSISGTLCSWKTCNSSTGEIRVENQTCASTSACEIAYCEQATGSCGVRSYCGAPPSSCYKSVCTEGNGSASCSYPALCSDTACSIAACTNGTCSYSARNCDDSNFCTIDACDTSVKTGSGCYYTNNTCSDGNSCTNDICDNSTQHCLHNTSYCNDGLSCTTDICTPNANASLPPTCTFTQIICVMNSTLNLTDQQNRCYKTVCSESELCLWQFVASSNTSDCQSCVEKTNSTKQHHSTCTSASSINTTAAIAAGAVAGIVIACIVGFAVFSAASAAGTYKLIQRLKAGKGLAAHNNPMYTPSDNEMVNPAYATR